MTKIDQTELPNDCSKLSGVGLKIGIVFSRFNNSITSQLLKGAEKTIKRHRPIIAIEDNKKNCSEFLGLCGYISPLAIPGLDIWVHKEQTDYIQKLKNINL